MSTPACPPAVGSLTRPPASRSHQRSRRRRAAARRGCPSSRKFPRSRKTIPEPATRSFDVEVTTISPGSASAIVLAATWTAMPRKPSSVVSTSPVCRPARSAMPIDAGARDDGLRALRSRERGHRTWRGSCRPRSRPPARGTAPAARARRRWWLSSSSRQRLSPSRVAVSVDSTMSVNRIVISIRSSRGRGPIDATNASTSRSDATPGRPPTSGGRCREAPRTSLPE